MAKKIGVYIHIPFCKKKCIYCDFISFASQENMQERYIECLKKEILHWKKKNKKNNYEISTIYIGGGTPSYVDSKKIEEVLKLLNDRNKKDNDKENEISVTIEVNPGTVTKQKLQDYKKAGINRLSIGLQSAKNELLTEIGRIHDYKDFLETYYLARESGFKNINVDLMIGLPNQRVEDIKDTLNKIIELSPEHISVYSLIVEEGTPIEKMIEKKELELPDEELERNMYWYVKDFLELNGYKHYEISNFAKPGFESKHNMDCWNQKEYIGFGLAAHSYIERTRFHNIISLEKYIENIEKNEYDKNIIVEEIQSREDSMKEYMILGLRKIDGIKISEFEEKFDENPIMIFKNELNKLVNEGLIIIDGNVIKISSKGLDLANLVWEEFI